jgi:hypothetical protein
VPRTGGRVATAEAEAMAAAAAAVGATESEPSIAGPSADGGLGAAGDTLGAPEPGGIMVEGDAELGWPDAKRRAP